LNRSLNKLTGRKRLRLDSEHGRYFFESDTRDEEVEISYRPLNLESLVSRKAVWRPRIKKTGEYRKYWHHLAVSLNFVHAGKNTWFLTLRPELRLTKDGKRSLEPAEITSRVTKLMTRSYNYDLLEDINFWRDFLSDGKPRISFDFGDNQKILISTTFMSSRISWPGMPEKFAKPFRNIEYEENLFTLAELNTEEVETWGEDD
jgi:hypothetical protein